MFDALGGTFRTVKLRPRKQACPCCGDNPTLLAPHLIDYEAFTGGAANDDGGDASCGTALLTADQRIHPGGGPSPHLHLVLSAHHRGRLHCLPCVTPA